MDKKLIVKLAVALVLLVAVIGSVFVVMQQKEKKDLAELEAPAPVVDETVSESVKTYTHPDFGFSFEYPDKFTLGNFPEEGGDMLVVQGADGKNGFQVFVSPYEEETQLSLEAIHAAAEGLTVTDAKEINIGQGKIRAFSFVLGTSEENMDDPVNQEDVSSADTTNEVWFVEAGNLYQITNYADFQSEMGKILESWRFN